MKILTATLMILLVMGMTVFARTPETLALKAGQQKRSKVSGLTVKFVSVIEDSRCPVGTNCVWAGNAKVKVLITGTQASKTFEFNTTVGPKGDIWEGWSITIDSLTPEPHAGKPTDPRRYQATFNIVRLTR